MQKIDFLIQDILKIDMCIICTTDIKKLVNLTKLNCSKCRNLTSIPKELVNLVYINCYGCPNLTSIPKELVNLTTLYCFRCPNLTSIHKELVNLTTLVCSNCPWLDVKGNKDYKQNIDSLVRCQRIFKHQILSRRILKLAPKLVPIWWDPECKGGFHHKKRLYGFVYSL